MALLPVKWFNIFHCLLNIVRSRYIYWERNLIPKAEINFHLSLSGAVPQSQNTSWKITCQCCLFTGMLQSYPEMLLFPKSSPSQRELHTSTHQDRKHLKIMQIHVMIHNPKGHLYFCVLVCRMWPHSVGHGHHCTASGTWDYISQSSHCSSSPYSPTACLPGRPCNTPSHQPLLVLQSHGRGTPRPRVRGGILQYLRWLSFC